MAQILALKKFPILLLAMAICLQFHPTSTRPLKSTTKMAPKLHQAPPPPAKTTISGDPSGASKKDFRPTAPGYSPGAGHINNGPNGHSVSRGRPAATGMVAGGGDSQLPPPPPGLGHFLQAFACVVLCFLLFRGLKKLLPLFTQPSN